MGNRHPSPPPEDDGSFPTKPRSQTITIPADQKKGKMNKQRTIKSSNRRSPPPPIGVVASTDSVEVGPAATMETIYAEDVEVGYDTTNISPTAAGGVGVGISSPPPSYSQLSHRKYDSDDSGSVFDSIDDSSARNHQKGIAPAETAPPVMDNHDAFYVTDNDKDGDEANRKRRCFIVLSILLLAAAIAIAIIVPLSKNKNRNLGPTEAPTIAPTHSDTRLGKVLDIIGKPWISDTHEEGYPNNPYAVEAINWLVYNDLAQLPIDGSVPSQVIQERYVMALLYFTTNGTQWINQDNMLSEKPICNWYGINCTMVTTKNANGESVEYSTVTHLDLGMSDLCVCVCLWACVFVCVPVVVSFFEDLTTCPLTSLFAAGENPFVGNQMSGSLPFAIAALSNLKRLNLGAFLLPSRLLPLTKSLCTNLALRYVLNHCVLVYSVSRSVFIDRNTITGTVPTSFGELQYLEELTLGTLPL